MPRERGVKAVKKRNRVQIHKRTWNDKQLAWEGITNHKRMRRYCKWPKNRIFINAQVVLHTSAHPFMCPFGLFPSETSASSLPGTLCLGRNVVRICTLLTFRRCVACWCSCQFVRQGQEGSNWYPMYPNVRFSFCPELFHAKTETVSHFVCLSCLRDMHRL